MGLFEADENVWKVKKVKKPAAPAAPKKKRQTLASKILAKVESKDGLVAAASSGGAVKFEDVDTSPAAQKKVKKTDKGIIEPLINYVSDDEV